MGIRVLDLLLHKGDVALGEPACLADEATEPNPEAAQVCAAKAAPQPSAVPKAMRTPVHNQAEALRALALAPQPMLKAVRTARVTGPNQVG